VFLPHATLVRVGQPLKIINSDAVAHNARTAPLAGTALNQILSANDQAGATTTYTKPETAPVGTKCDIHAWMASFHLPVNHPWAAVTGPDGSFEIADVPATDLEFVVWHEKGNYIHRSLKVTIAADQTVEQEIIVDAAKLTGK
jgi:hypothetical protein